MPTTEKEYVGLVRVPTPTTLHKYGLTKPTWSAILDRQGGVCAVCYSVPKSGTLHIDHEHIKGWATMHPDDRRRFVRGLICWFDNNVLLRRGSNPDRLRAAATYLESYELRKASYA